MLHQINKEVDNIMINLEKKGVNSNHILLGKQKSNKNRLKENEVKTSKSSFRESDLNASPITLNSDSNQSMSVRSSTEKQEKSQKQIYRGKCEECGDFEFEYDSYWDEYTCRKCGRITKTLGEKNQVEPIQESEEKYEEEEIWNGEDNISKKIKSGYKWQNQKAFFKDYHNSLIGKRDGWTWFYGIVVPLASILHSIWEINSISNLSIPKRIIDAFIVYEILFVLIISVVCGSFFFAKLWARKAMYWIPVSLSIIFFIIMNGKLTPDAITQFIARIIAGSLIFLIIFYFATRTVSNKSFFSIHVSDDDIKKYWLSISNRQAFWCVVISFILPLIVAGSFILISRILDIEHPSKFLQILGVTGVVILLVINIGLSIKARQREDFNAIPPIGGKGSSYLSIIISACWIVLILFGLFRLISGNGSIGQ